MTQQQKRKLHRLMGFLMACVACLMGSAPAFAQSEQGIIVGTVRDLSKGVLPGVTVVVRNERTGEERYVVTSNEGLYRITSLKPSMYTVKATLPSFAPSEMKQVQLAAGQQLMLDVVLRPEGTSAEITVVGSGEATVDTSSARIGTNVNEREVAELPINGRQLSQLYLQAPGSVNTGSGTFADIRFSGRSNQQNLIRYDGIEGSAIIDANPGNLNGEIPSPFRLQTSLENVQEFRVESSNYPAEYGTSTGGQISVVTKSGTNQFHGSLFEYLRNDALDARNFFDLDKKSPLRLNQFGGSVGGPIIREKAFFFFSYEGYRLRSGINSIEAVPNALARERAVPAIKPLIDAFRSPKAVILPNASGNSLFDIAQLQDNITVRENAVGTRFDYKFNEQNMLYARYYRDQGFNDQPEGVTGRRSVVKAVPQNAVVSLQSGLTNNLFNEFKVGFNEALTRVNGTAPVVNGIDLSRLVINLTGSVANNGIAGQGSTSGIATPGGLLRQNSATNGRGAPYTPYSFSFIDGMSWVKGQHNPKFGGEIRAIRMYTDRLGGTTYTFQNIDAFLANTPQQVQFLGDVSEPSPFNNGATGNRKTQQEYYIFYGQDEWKVRPGLTLNYGLRYEYYTVLHEARNLNVQFDIYNGTLLPPTRPMLNSRKTNFQPRLAVSWSPNVNGDGFFGGGRTVLRAGVGIYNGPGQTEDQIQPIESDRISSTLTGGAFPVDPEVLRANFLNNPQNRQFQPRAYDPAYTIPERIYQYTFSVQQELPYKMALTAAYVGSQGRNLFLRSWTNRIINVRTNPNPAQNAIVIRQFDIVQGDTILRPFAEIDYKTSGGRDSYNALQMALARRFNRGLTLNSQYTYSKSFGNTSGSNDALTATNPFDFNADRGYNPFDVRHSFNLSAIYSLPIGRGRTYLSNLDGIGETLLGGWEVGTILNARSGLPIDVRITRPDVAYVDADGNVFGTPAAGRTAVINTIGGGGSRNVRRPDVVPGVNPFITDNGTVYLNPAAFATPKPGAFGNLQKGFLHGPNFRQLDLTFIKRFHLTESSNLEFRAEFFNLFNIANFTNPPATLPNALGTGANQVQPGQPFTREAVGSVFGIFTQTVERTVGLGTNRQIQFALRYNF